VSYEDYEDFDPGEPLPDGDSGGHASSMFLGVELRPLKEIYGVFRRPSNEADLRARDLAQRTGVLEGDSPDDLSHPGMSEEARAAAALGDIVVDGGRLVFSGLGGATDMLYVAPTTNNKIVHAVLPNGGGGTGSPGPDGLVLSVNSMSPGAVVMGLVGDAIMAVDLVVDGKRLEAQMSENGFGLRIDDGAVEGIVLHRQDGTSMELQLPTFRDVP
jgi:hypothetical protein